MSAKVEAGDSVAKTQLGPNAQAPVISLRVEYRIPMRGISAAIGQWFGLSISAGGVRG
jgi:hypothetical protein